MTGSFYNMIVLALKFCLMYFQINVCSYKCYNKNRFVNGKIWATYDCPAKTGGWIWQECTKKGLDCSDVSPHLWSCCIQKSRTLRKTFKSYRRKNQRSQRSYRKLTPRNFFECCRGVLYFPNSSTQTYDRISLIEAL